jgi:hypothetical protein
MVTITDPTTARPTATRTRHRTADAASIVFFGTVAWLAFVWLAATVVYGVVVACVARWGSVDESLWQSVASGWQRYVVFAAGITVSTTFLRMLVRNGATRRLLSAGAIATMAGLATILALWNVAGYSIEKVIYDRYDWPQTLRSGSPFEWADLPRAAIDNGLMVAAYYATGWIVGACYARWGAVGGTLRLLPAILPAAAMELLVAPDFGGVDVDALASWLNRPPAVVTIIAGGAVVWLTAMVARRLTRDVALC